MARNIRTLSALLAALALVCPLSAEPAYRAISVSQTVGSTSLPRSTQEVTIVSDGASTCYFRLFTDADTAGNATTSSLPLKSGEALSFKLDREAGTEAVGVNGKALYYKSISAICSTGQTATWRVYSK